MLVSVAIVVDTGEYPMAGPPVRISRPTPVSLPSLSMRLPETIFFSMSTV